MVDRRTGKTLAALRKAFVKLIGERRYDSILVSDIINEANVGKSTFYEHYRSKDEFVISLMDGMLAELAACGSGDKSASLHGLLEHFWASRQLGRIVFAPPMSQIIGRRLAALIAQRANGDCALIRLGAINRAAGQISLLHAWTTGEVAATVQQVAEALQGAPLAASASDKGAPLVASASDSSQLTP